MKRSEMPRLVFALFAFTCGLAVHAMPTRAELAQAQPIVNDLTADDLRALKSKEKKPGDVAAAHLALADKADTEAGKYLLLQGAFRLYARSGDYDAAAATLQRMRSEIADLPPELIVEIVNNEMRRVAATKAPKVLAIFRDAQRMIKYRKQLAAAELDATAHPENARYQRRVAECHACLGDWPKALEIFAKIGDEAAKWELGTAKDCDAAKAADFWWNYKAADVEPFKAHAAALYKKGLEDGSITGLRKTLAEKRVKEMDGVMMAAPAVVNVPAVSRGGVAAAVPSKTKAIDLGGGVKIEMICVAPGSFMMGRDDGNQNSQPAHRVTLTKGYWLGKYEVTQRQWQRVMGMNPSHIKGDNLPVDSVSWNDCQTFIRKVNSALGDNRVRLPTEAEWEYACCAGTAGDFGGTGQLDDMGWYKANSGGTTHPVGQKHPNAWDFYDMHGNVREWCHDRWDAYPHGEVTDPTGPSVGDQWVSRGGGCNAPKEWCTSFHRWKESATFVKNTYGFRLCMTAEGVAPAVSPKASDVAPAKRGKSIMVKIKNGIELEFVPCPAGTFTMGATQGANTVTGQWVAYNPDDIEYKHEVTITRPFWMSKYPITVEQFGAFCPINDVFIKQNGKQGESKMPVCLRAAAAEDYCKWLNRRFASSLPEKCIFRLPTDAEWEYAIWANSTDEDDLYVRLRKINTRKIMNEICGTKFPVPVGTAGKPNAWGLYDMLGNGCHYVLDTISSAAVVQDACYGYVVPEKLKCGYKESEIDPLRLYVPKDDKTKACHLMRGGSYAFWAKKKGPTVRCRMVECGEINRNADNPDRPRIWTFRVVIGPDLVAEKMAGKK